MKLSSKEIAHLASEIARMLFSTATVPVQQADALELRKQSAPGVSQFLGRWTRGSVIADVERLLTRAAGDQDDTGSDITHGHPGAPHAKEGL